MSEYREWNDAIICVDKIIEDLGYAWGSLDPEDKPSTKEVLGIIRGAVKALVVTPSGERYCCFSCARKEGWLE